MTPRLRRRALIILGAVLLLLALGLSNTLRNKAELTIIQHTPAERLEMLGQSWRMVPPGAPVESARALLMSGCDGPRDNMDYWGETMAASGRPALVVDSHKPRSFDRFEAWRLVCAGQLLPGAERAGDIAVALTATHSPAVALLGASHGGWSVMELLDRLATGEPPTGLTAWPADPAQLARRIDRVILLYPYCGILNGARDGDWSGLPPVLLVAAENDSIVSTPACVQMADDLRTRGADVRVIVMPGVDHGFDQADRSFLSNLTLVPEARAEARREIERFIAGTSH